MKTRCVLIILLVATTGAFLSESVASTVGAAGHGQIVRNQATTDWPSYLANAARTSNEPGESLITADSATSLATRWELRGGSPISDEPVESAGVVYWGSWDGYMHGTTIYGKTRWATFIGQTNTGPDCDPTQVGVASSATVATETVGGTPQSVAFVGGGDAQLYALNAATGAVLWHKRLGQYLSGFLWDSPLVVGTTVYMGVSSFGDCPLVRGRLYKIEATTGKIINTFNAAPKDCIGNGIWGSPTYDPRARTIYITDGNDGSCSQPEPLSESIIEVNSQNMKLVGYWPVPISQRNGDSDFGATPTLFSYLGPGKTAVPMVGAVNKNGYYYAFRRDHLSAGPVWTHKVGVGGEGPQDGSADISPSAWDGSRLYIATGNANYHNQTCAGMLNAVNPATGAFIWRDCLPSQVLGAVIQVPGLVEVGSGSEVIVASTADGSMLYHGDFPGSTFWGPGSFSEGTLYCGDMSGNLFALSPSGTF